MSLARIMREAAVRKYLPTVAEIQPRDLLELGRAIVTEDDQVARRVHAALSLALGERFPGDSFYRGAETSPAAASDRD
jgi:hypothetical protein